MIGIIYGNNRAIKPIISKESAVQTKEKMLLLVECVCPYHKRKRR
jgi:hypothetical protein